MTHSQLKPGYIPELDGLRAISIALVIQSHWLHIGIPLNLGDLGVTIFFVISGFLITRILLDEKSLNDAGQISKKEIFKRFFLKRLIRIFPIYYLLLISIYIFNRGLLEDSLKWHLTYLSNYYFVIVRGDWQGSLSPLWSLSVEEQYYIIWPMLVLFIPYRGFKYVLICTIVIGPIFRLVYFNPNLMHKYLTPGCFDALGLGALIAYDEKGVLLIANRYIKIISTFILLLIISIYGLSYIEDLAFKEVFERLLYSILATLLMIRLFAKNNSCLNKGLRYRPIIFIGTISYGLYLYHNLIPFYTIKDIPFVFSYLLRAFVLLVAATLSYYLVERPVMSLKKFIK